MKSILIPVETHAGMSAVLETARLLAQKFASYIEGVALGPDLTQIVAADFSLDGIVFDYAVRRDLLDEARKTFESFMRDAAIPPRSEAADASAPSYGWVRDGLISDTGVGEYGRVFDIIAVGRPGPGAEQPRKSTLEAVLTESGRPLLIAPPRAPERLGEVIAIAWNRNSETARTVAFALPLLKLARDVPVFTIPGYTLAGPDHVQLVENLKRHGVPARAIDVHETAKTPGLAVLVTARSVGADLLIKGGYTQSRLRQFIFGRATGQILAEANIPIFMAH
ncbi:universal stress protein [Methylovirgula ligni]|uniref:Universal stress protein family protein n=1 Tax=Methylovirgula ligni TaxID=569860 RepID=A0A3D9YY82_9HYPH|nr:universal stress protein [Methylovirgula ligni]QAY94774.1 universal stress protein [Methylovirgula ligni]REF87325.1 universal stress protein family protein [Methylovirgula ligni]